MSFVNRLMSGSLIAVMALAVGANAAKAEDAGSLFSEAKKLYEARDRYNYPADKNASNELAIGLLEKAEKLVGDDDEELLYDILVLESRAIYWRGMNVAGSEEDNDAKVPVFAAGRAKALAAVELDGEFADAYYYAGINFSRWGLAMGVAKSFGERNNLKAVMNKTISKKTKAGLEGRSIDGYGPARVLGRMAFKLPPLFGRDNKESKKLLTEAYEKGSEVALNAVYLAETLYDRFDDAAQAKDILNKLLANNPDTCNVSRRAETHLEFAEARALLKKIK